MNRRAILSKVVSRIFFWATIWPTCQNIINLQTICNSFQKKSNNQVKFKYYSIVDVKPVLCGYLERQCSMPWFLSRSFKTHYLTVSDPIKISIYANHSSFDMKRNWMKLIIPLRDISLNNKAMPIISMIWDLNAVFEVKDNFVLESAADSFASYCI